MLRTSDNNSVGPERGQGDAISKEPCLSQTVRLEATAGHHEKWDESPFLRAARTSRPISILKNLVYILYLYCGYVATRDLVLSLLGRSRAVVVYYHRVGVSDVLSKPAAEFRADLAYLKKHYECITLAELSRRLAERGRFRRRSAVITFDDGYRDNYAYAVPLLKEARLPATFFVATGYIGTRREFPHDHRSDSADAQVYPKLEWADLRAMEKAGFEIASHTVNHVNLGKATPAEVEIEVVSSLAALNRHLDERPRAFSFPWGTPADMTEEARQAVKDAGYYAACAAYGGANTWNGDLFQIMRIDVGNGSLGRLATRARIAGFRPDYFRFWIGRLRPGLRIVFGKLAVRRLARGEQA